EGAPGLAEAGGPHQRGQDRGTNSLEADVDHRLGAEHADARHDGRIFAAAAVAAQLEEGIAEVSDVVVRGGPLGVPRQLDRAPSFVWRRREVAARHTRAALSTRSGREHFEQRAEEIPQTAAVHDLVDQAALPLSLGAAFARSRLTPLALLDQP